MNCVERENQEAAKFNRKLTRDNKCTMIRKTPGWIGIRS
jgi:hypothetical protein